MKVLYDSSYKNRMSTKTFDTHCICVTCRGNDCSYNVQCDECADWLDDHMRTYVKYYAKLEGKSHVRVLCKALFDIPSDASSLFGGSSPFLFPLTLSLH